MVSHDVERIRVADRGLTREVVSLFIVCSQTRCRNIEIAVDSWRLRLSREVDVVVPGCLLLPLQIILFDDDGRDLVLLAIEKAHDCLQYSGSRESSPISSSRFGQITERTRRWYEFGLHDIYIGRCEKKAFEEEIYVSNCSTAREALLDAYPTLAQSAVALLQTLPRSRQLSRHDSEKSGS